MTAYILACPFCGKPPVTTGSGEGQRGLMIECITDGCVNPHVSYYAHKAAIHKWNLRVSGAGRLMDTNGEQVKGEK